MTSSFDKPFELKGGVALVTGSARRVGKEIALELARQGMHLVIHHSRSEAEAQAVADEVEALGSQSLIVRADLSQPAEVERLFTEIQARYGRLDVLVNSAANFLRGAIRDLSLDEWHEALTVNLTAPFLVSQQAAQLMGERGGAIVNIADLSAYKGWVGYPAHSVAKAGLVNLTKVLAKSLGPTIRVNAIVPGPVLRDEGNSPEQWAQIGARLPLKRTGDPADVARAVAFLVAQPFITGTILHVDGGESLL